MGTLWKITVSSAVRADALDKVVNGVHAESLGKLDLRDVDGAETECSLAACTIEVDMLVVNGTIIMSFASLVLRGARTILNGMYEPVRQEKGEGTEYGGTIHGIKLIVKLTQGEGTMMLDECPIH